MRTKFMALILLCYAFCTSCKKDDAPQSQSLRDESQNYTLGFVAGNVDFGYVNGTGAAAKFNTPTGLAIDASNNIYVADRDNNRIRKISAGNVVTTYAGTGVVGALDGNISQAQFDMPRFLAFDPAGNLLIVDSMRLRLRKISPAGIVSTVNMNRVPGYADGPLSSAQFGSLDDLAIDAAGNIFIPDGVNHRIRKINSAGIVTTVAGSGDAGHQDGNASTAKFLYPIHIAVDPQGNLYVQDGHYIRKISSGNVSTLATIGDQNSVSTFVTPSSLTVDAQGTVYVGVSQSIGGAYLAKLSPTGELIKIAGGAAWIDTITDITTDQNNSLYFIDFERIRKVTKN